MTRPSVIWRAERRFPEVTRATASFRSLPDFLVIGAQKGGSTSLHKYLSAHPLVMRPLRKEVNYFARHFARGEGWYRAHFPTRAAKRLRGGQAITGESTPYYLRYPHAADRAGALVPEARILLVLRDPVERAYSHYQHQVRLDREGRDFEVALAEEADLLQPELDRMDADPSYVSTFDQRHAYAWGGCYATQLGRWRKHFDDSQVLVVFTEDLQVDGDRVLREAWDFLGLPHQSTAVGGERHNSGGYTPMDPATRAKLAARFQDENHQLELALDRRLPWQ